MGFFFSLSSSKNLTPGDPARVFIPTNHTGERCGTRFVDKLRLSARGTSIVISIAVRSLSCAALDCCRQDTHGGGVCGYMWTYTQFTQSLLRSADSKTANTRLGATKPQTKANTIAAGVSRAYVVSMSDRAKETSQKRIAPCSSFITREIVPTAKEINALHSLFQSFRRFRECKNVPFCKCIFKRYKR